MMGLQGGGESRELFKGVLADRARGVFQGKVIVRPNAQKTDGKQMAQALLLSETDTSAPVHHRPGSCRRRTRRARSPDACR